jgi:hypothetical protein
MPVRHHAVMRARVTRWPLRVAAAACLASLAAVSSARAGGVGMCAEPFAFSKAEVNVIVLPYFAAGSAPRSLDGVGSRLALLVKLETLYRAMSYDHWGVVLLTGTKQECDPERVAAQLLQRKMIPPGGRMIIVWGNLFVRQDEVYEQTFARAYRQPMPNERTPRPDVELAIGGKSFQGRSGAESFAFPPEQLSLGFIDEISRNFEQAVYLYSAPSLTAPKTQIRLDQFVKCDDCRGSLAFTVMRQVGDWLQVEMQSMGRRTGYLAARQGGGTTLAERMPEIGFLHGLMGYLRTVRAKSGAATPNAMRVASDAFASYARRDEAAQEPDALSAALRLGAILDYRRGSSDSPAPFDSAYRLAPFSADGRNLAAMFGLRRAWNQAGPSVRPRDAANDFLAAAALDPDNALVLANLQSFYELIGRPAAVAKIAPDVAIAPDEIRTQLEKVRAIRAQARATPQSW